jgi:hypothetical protein
MNAKDVLSQLDNKVLAGKQLGAFDDRFGRKLLRLYAEDILDPWTTRQITKRVDRLLRKEAMSTSRFRQPRLHTGELILGFDEYGNPIRSPIQYLNAGLLTVANTGAGKTTLISFYAIQTAPHVRGMWLVDLRKKEFRLLRPEFARRGIYLVIVRARAGKINPLQVPDSVDPREYACLSADILVKVLNLPGRAAVLLTSTITKLYKKYNVFRGGRKYPTLFHLFEAVRVDKTANAQARQATLDNLEPVLLSLGTQVLGYHKGWPVGQLARHHIVFELTGQSEVDKDLVLNYLVGAQFIFKLCRGVSNQTMDSWMSIDEGQRLFSRHKETYSRSGNCVTDLAGLVRGTGTGVHISVLTPDDLSNKVPSFTSTKIMGRCGSVSEYTAAGRFMGLNQDQIQWCAHHLVPGTFVAQVSDGPWRYPFLLRIPKPNKLKPVSDSEADESLKPLVGLKVEPVEFTEWSPTPRIDVRDDANAPQTVAEQLTPSAYRLLQAIVDHPMLPSSAYVKLARISPNTLSKLRPILLEKGLVKEHVMDSSDRGRSKRIWEPTEAAKDTVVNHSTNQED